MLASGSILLAVTFVSLDCISPLDSECDKGNDRDWLIAMLLVHARLLSLWHENHWLKTLWRHVFGIGICELDAINDHVILYTIFTVGVAAFSWKLCSLLI